MTDTPSTADTLASIAEVMFDAGHLLDVAGPLFQMRGVLGVLTSGNVTIAGLMDALPHDMPTVNADAAAVGKLALAFMTVNADPTYGPRLRAAAGALKATAAK